MTLLEVLIALAITAVIIGPLLLATTTLMTNPQTSADQNTVLQEVRNAGYWVSRDVQMAGNVTPGENYGFPLTLDIPVDTDENNNYEIRYLSYDNKLKREVYDSSEILISETFVANYVATDNTTFSAISTDLYKLTIKASRGETTITRVYEVSQRCSSG